MLSIEVPPLQVLVAHLSARGLPQRLAAVAMVSAAGTMIARLPTPALRVDLESASYPAVLVGALVPVLVGVLGAVPVRVRLSWLIAGDRFRAGVLAGVEIGSAAAICAAGALACGLPADLVGAAVQNALITFLGVTVAATLLGRAAAGLVGSSAVLVLLASPAAGQSAWVLVDALGDVEDWWALIAATPLAFLAVLYRSVSRGVCSD